MTVQPRKEAPDLSQFFEEPQGSKKAKARAERKAERQAKKCVSPKALTPRTEAQAEYLDALERYQQVFSLGPAGCGKTYVAAYWAAGKVMSGEYKKIVLCRPMVLDRSEDPGALPGTLEEKFAPWAMPVVEAIEEAIGRAEFQRWVADGKFQVTLIGHLPGRTMKDSFVLLDEAQNMTRSQMATFNTRIGERSKIIVDGDLAQKKIPGESGLAEAVDIAEEYGEEEGIAVVRFTSDDVVRSGLCRFWVQEYEDRGVLVE